MAQTKRITRTHREGEGEKESDVLCAIEPSFLCRRWRRRFQKSLLSAYFMLPLGFLLLAYTHTHPRRQREASAVSFAQGIKNNLFRETAARCKATNPFGFGVEGGFSVAPLGECSCTRCERRKNGTM